MVISRRQISGWLGAAALSGLLGRRAVASFFSAPQLGLNTWSLRSLKHEQAIPAILALMKQTGLRDCQLLFSHAEPDIFDPGFNSPGNQPGTTTPSPEEQQRKAEARTAWRLSVPLTYFEAIRARFHQEGLRIRVYNSPLGSSAEEIDRVLLFAKSLGAEAINTRLKEELTDLVAAAAARHDLSVGIQVVDPQVALRQLHASSRFRLDPDIGDLTKAGVPALAFLQEHLPAIASIDLKDAMPHGPSVPFGTGAAHMREVLELLGRTPNHAISYIDCDYPGTGVSADEVKRCLDYVRGVIQQAQSPG